jgi:IS5 family transposase
VVCPHETPHWLCQRAGLIHSVESTAANVHGITKAADRLHREEQVVYAEAGYRGIDKQEEMAGKPIEFRVAMRPGNC